jgi:hypothetical protein
VLVVVVFFWGGSFVVELTQSLFVLFGVCSHSMQGPDSLPQDGRGGPNTAGTTISPRQYVQLARTARGEFSHSRPGSTGSIAPR